MGGMWETYLFGELGKDYTNCTEETLDARYVPELPSYPCNDFQLEKTPDFNMVFTPRGFVGCIRCITTSIVT